MQQSNRPLPPASPTLNASALDPNPADAGSQANGVAPVMPATDRELAALRAEEDRAKRASRRSFAVVQLSRAIVYVSLLVIWQLAVRRKWVNPFFLASPSDTGRFLHRLWVDGLIWANWKSTMEATLLAFVVGSLGGVICGFVLGRIPTLDRVFYPLIVLFNSLPRVALAPLFILWFGLGQAPKVFTGISLSFFLLLMSARASARAVDPGLILLAATIGMTKAQIYLKIILPSSLQETFAGLRTALVYSLLGVTVSEMFAARDGLGVLLARYSNSFQIAGVLAVLVILAATSLVLSFAATLAERRVMRWSHATSTGVPLA